MRNEILMSGDNAPNPDENLALGLPEQPFMDDMGNEAALLPNALLQEIDGQGHLEQPQVNLNLQVGFIIV
jgi:hypothetical protein